MEVLGARFPVLKCLVPCLVLCSLLVLSACGSKGDPLPPLRLVPAKAEGLTALRVEGRPIRLSFVVPAANDDGSVPVDISAMRVFAVTMPASDKPPTVLDLIGGDLIVATIDVVVPQADTARQSTGAPQTAAPTTEPPQPGATITWEDPTVVSATYPTPMVRYYAVAAMSRRNRIGVASDLVAVPLDPVPDAPRQLAASFTDKVIKLDWLGATPGTRYRVYEVKKGAADTALNAQPVEGTTFEVPLAAADAEGGVAAALGVERCFTVRAARATAGASLESAAAPAACVTPKDVFPPSAPANLTAVASEGAISLIWDAVDAPDLAGYLVLRAEAPGDTLLPLFATPIVETRYQDTTAEAGKRYVYAVVAVDSASPPNRSAESNRVTETGRN